MNDIKTGGSADEMVKGPGKVPIKLRVNGRDYDLYVEPRYSLLSVLRTQLGLTGTKQVCNNGECGACTVLIDGQAIYACLTLAIECEGQEIVTIEGLARGDDLHPIQRAFIEKDGYQCGFCTPGQVLAAKALLDRVPDPTIEQIKRGVSGNLCRCGAYAKIFDAIKRAAALLREEKHTPGPAQTTPAHAHDTKEGHDG